MLLPKNLCNICMCYRPFLLKLVELCITFQQRREIHNLFVVKFCWYCFSGAKGSDYSPFRDTTPCSSATVLHERYRNFQHSMFCC
jgi:hypothetical protein